VCSRSFQRGRRVVGTGFYSVTNARHFLGTVALVNSLRRVGHAEPVILLDCGLEPWQRTLLAGEAAILPSASCLPPHLLKAEAPLARPADVMVIVDSDIIVIRSLQPLIAAARQGKIVSFADALADRFHPAWADMVRAPILRRGSYVNSGLLTLPRDPGLRLLQRLEQSATFVDPALTMIGVGAPSDPLFFLDQDIVNALLASEFDVDEVEVLPHRLAPHPPFPGVSIVNETTLACADAEGEQPFLLHHIQQKPWLHRLPASAYSKLLTRLLLASDLPVQVPRERLPLRLRTGPSAQLARAQASLHKHANDARRRAGIRRRSPQATAPAAGSNGLLQPLGRSRI
jgi:hypothetical protein